MEHKEPMDVMDGVLMKHLLGEAGPDEQRRVNEWLNENEANRKYFEQFKRIWKESEALAAHSTADENAAWDKFLSRVNQQPPRTIPMSPGRNWMRAAAIIFVLIGAGYLLFNTIWPSHPDYIVWQSGDKVLTDTLPDGSVVTLNKGTTLSFPEAFEGKERFVKLQGEAFFEVTKNKEKPFVIAANEARVQVFGTSFNVQTTEEKTVVIVESGIVEVAKNDHAVRLNADEKATVTKEDDDPLKERNEDYLYQYYKSKEFVLNATPLWRFADVLSQAYNVHIIIENNAIRDMKLTTTFKNEPLQNVLVVVGETLNITIERRGENIIFR